VNGPQHWREADLILTSDPCEYGCPHSGCAHELRMIGRAQVHATMALGAAVITSMLRTLQPAGRHEWLTAIDPEYAAEQDATPARPTGGTT
jgi:hypothetical protein